MSSIASTGVVLASKTPAEPRYPSCRNEAAVRAHVAALIAGRHDPQIEPEWTETLTIAARPDDLEEQDDRIRRVAGDLGLTVNNVTARQRRSWTRVGLDVSLTGKADRTSDFQETFAGEGWNALPEGSLLDPLINEGLQSTHNWLRRKRRQRRADRAAQDERE